ncbi:DUF3971 domain-containing protein [Marinicella sp. S1101]|uniref:YhdP family phospholipid transporter n=1 Tax=Marinicella marina TaxID=2996016 RepID=UPI00226102D3|nr:AsmA-like C-terminal region-containing protein [Marinicella marina]MCX7553800.1 DUF3971 domain-containing protein [Marinicella marina]MDJ1140876.1 AsmA-like C-terminal region-containing protein [Marinicella marina]
MAKHKKYRWYYRIWIKIRLVLAGLVILAGLAVGALSLFLPFESLYQDRLEKFLEEQWNLVVKVKEINGSWRGYGPHFQLYDLELTGKQSVQLASANLAINIYQLIIPGGRSGIDLSINRAELDMIQSAEGASITLNDTQDEARFADMLDRILTTGSLRVDEMMFNLADENGQVLLAGLQADLLLQQDDDERALKLLIENDNQSIEIISQGLRNNTLTKDANWYMEFNQFELGQLNELLTGIKFPAGAINGQLWLSAKAGQITSMSGEISWRNPESGLGFEIKIKQFSEDKDWVASMQFTDVVIAEEKYDDFLLRIQRQNDTTQLQSSQIPLALFSQLAEDAEYHVVADKPFNAVAGIIDVAEFEMANDTGLWRGALQFSDFALGHEVFDFTGLNGTFEFDSLGGNLLLDSEQGHLNIPAIYRGQLNWQDLTVQNSIDWSGDAAVMAINNLWCDCVDFDLQLWSHLQVGQPSNMLLASVLSQVEVNQLYKYWPHNVWKPKTIEWLDRGLLSGQVSKGYVFMNGDLVPKTFKTGAATFISRAYTDKVANIFHPEWPQVNNIDGVAVFDHDSVQVEISNAETGDIAVYQADVAIDSFDAGVLDVDLKASSNGNEILEYLRDSPLVKNIELSEAIKIDGQQRFDLNFEVGIKSDVNLPFRPWGQVRFEDGVFATEHFSIEGINGPVNLDGYALKMDGLPAQLGAAEIELNGEIITKSETGFQIDVDLSGELNATYLLDVIQQNLPIEGASDWLINIRNKQSELQMTASSPLLGTTIGLPAPLDKTAGMEKTLTVSCQIPCQSSNVEINYNDEIRSTLDGRTGSYHLARLQFLNTDLLAAQEQLYGGTIARVNLDKWLDLIAQYNQSEVTSDEADAWPIEEIELDIGEMIFMSRAFKNITLNIKRAQQHYAINVIGDDMDGLVIVDDDLANKGIVAQFKYLNWIDPSLDLDEIIEDAASSKVPDIHLWSESFEYAGIPLGALRMEMRNVADGIKIEQLSLKSPEAEINASGVWLKEADGVGQSNFDIVMISEKIADFLQQVGFAAPITNAQTIIELNAQWPGVPSQFNVADIDGDLSIKIGQGQVLDQKPGFGRVLGLFNLTNLPRRLILDFRDVLADGLLFSSMEGHFQIKSGVAKTEDFLITASSAKIRINGDVNFADQTYNQTIIIRPQIGKTFPTIGAIAGGPVGAAAGFLVQGLFDKQLKKGNEINYAVTGTWDDPIIELIENNDE